MINKEIEEYFIKNFIIKEKRQRILFELSSKSKRPIAISKLIQCIDTKTIVFNEKKVDDEILLGAIKKTFDIRRECYIIGDRTEHDGTFMRFVDAFRWAMEDSVACILICGEGTVFMKEETSFGSPAKMILKKIEKA